MSKSKKIDDRLIREKSAEFYGMSPYMYPATITAVHDGDTVTADIDLGFDIVLRGQKIRLHGINAPELTVKSTSPVCRVDNPPGLASRENLKDLIGPLPAKVVLESFRDKKEKYGRYLATVWPSPDHASKISQKLGIEKYNCNEMQLKLGFAKPMKF
jgi:endonuclease YncB( thermonuclease family)